MSLWTPHSWRDRPILQQPSYPDADALKRATDTLALRPPLVTSGEIDTLRAELAAAARGECFVLQGGDCAESFDECRGDIIANRLRVLLQMSLVLTHGLKQRVVRIGRFAGQYAKPRSADTETRDGVELPSFRGDLVNAPEFTAEARTPQPQRLLEGHALAALSLNHVRALIDGGFADLHHPENWDLAWMQHTPHAQAYARLVAEIENAVGYFETLSGQRLAHLDRIQLFSSHEALVMEYEAALTHAVGPDHYNLGCHMPWIGMRTAQPDGAHVEYCRGIANPVGVKLGPGLSTDDVLRLLSLLDPQRTPGRLVLIHRFGHARIEDELPSLIEAVAASGHPALWLCDPMHGNTQTTGDGLKTRDFAHVLGELLAAFRVHRQMGSRLGGVHLELTGENVTECTGGARALSAEDLKQRYRSQVDPRLNGEQALELAMAIATAASDA